MLLGSSALNSKIYFRYNCMRMYGVGFIFIADEIIARGAVMGAWLRVAAPDIGCVGM